MGENALYLLAEAPVVVRIARTRDYWADAVKEVHVSRWLARYRYPAARTYTVSQPIDADGHPVTFWRYIDGRDGSREDIATLGHLLRRLHSLPSPTTFLLPTEDVLGRVEGRIEKAPIPSSDKDFLFGCCDRLNREISDLAFPLAPCVTHGDAHVNNLMMRDGEGVLIDFERFAWGQPEWDLAMTATEYCSAGWWTDAEYAIFVDAYGFDVTRWSGFDVLRRVHEIKMTTWVMQNIEESDDIATEYLRRIGSIRTGVVGGWRAF
ncbi:aminoglycoside phosphotransferase family protein [Parafrankia soli]|uniref:aminoglycoside phosphotransferase family protein n=1 Tax=Parafrankia soli TaxID=2599596 RepID=UPI0012FFCF88|nr:aminoglycoside phosphotransferase family protein [Parafrankia soli]